MPTVVLIGPPGAGKSTVGPLLAASLGAWFVDVDEVGDVAYDAAGQPLALFEDRIARTGFAAAHRWWQPARLAAATAAIADHAGSVIAFGAGHSHYEDPAFAVQLQSIVAGCHVVLLLPDPDASESLRVLRRRCVDSKRHGWVIDGVDHLAAWSISEQNRQLADSVVYALDRTPLEYAAAIRSEVIDCES